MVDIKINQRNALDAAIAIHVASVRRADSDVIQQAESMAAFLVVVIDDDATQPGVMPRRPHGTERVATSARADAVDGRAAAGQPRLDADLQADLAGKSHISVVRR